MANAFIHEKNISKLLKHIHPNLLSDLESYKVGTHYIFPTYHGCWYRNRNETRKKYNAIEEKFVLFLFILLVVEKQKRNI